MPTFFIFIFFRLRFYSYGWYFTFVQGWVYVALIYLQGFTPAQMVNPWKTYVKLSAVLMGSHGLTKGSLAFLNYPAQLMFKSTKVNFLTHWACIRGLDFLHPWFRFFYTTGTYRYGRGMSTYAVPTSIYEHMLCIRAHWCMFNKTLLFFFFYRLSS